MIGLVTQVLDERQLLVAHLRRDLLEYLAAGNLVRQRTDDDVAVLLPVRGAQSQRSVAAIVDLLDIASRRYELAARRKVRSLDVFHDLRDGRFRVVDQVHERTGDFVQVVRRHVGGQADRDTGCAVEQQVRQACRQYQRFIDRAVEIRHPADGAVAEFR